MRTGVSKELFIQSAILGSVVCYGQAAIGGGMAMMSDALDNASIVLSIIVIATAPFSGCLCAVLYAARDDPQHFADEDCRCRHCKYILRGLTEPRCPECGETI